MKAKIKILDGKTILFQGELVANVGKYGPYDNYGAEDKFHEDLFNIEQYINAQGAYRCHVEVDIRNDPD